MGEGDRHARFSLASGARRALGVAFGVNGGLDAAVAAARSTSRSGSSSTSGTGRSSPGSSSGASIRATPIPMATPGPTPAPMPANDQARIADEEFWARVAGELETALEPAPLAAPGSARERIDRRGGSAIATIAALASSGESVLAICADALRRRELIERAARPARFGGGALGIASGRLPDAHATAALGRVREAGAGCCSPTGRRSSATRDWRRASSTWWSSTRRRPRASRSRRRPARATCTWSRGRRRPSSRFASTPTIGPRAPGWRASSASFASAGDAPSVRDALVGSRRAHPLSPEVAARSARVLAELGLVGWARSDGPAALRVVSSEATDLERSTAYGAYRRRHEETRRFLTRARQSRRPRPS